MLGAEHPRTLGDRADFAYWTGAAGDAAGARDQYAALLPVRERISGAEHPHTLAARARRAYWTGEVGDAAAARDLFAALLPIREQVLGPQHPDTETTRGDLAYWTAQAAESTGPPYRSRHELATAKPCVAPALRTPLAYAW